VPVRGQSAMQGIVRDDSTARPLAGVEVILGTTGLRTITNEQGRYVLGGLPTGRHQAIFRQVGFLPGRVEVLLVAGDTVRVNMTLSASTVVLDPLEVTALPSYGLAGQGFAERMRLGLGSFYEAEELREMEHLRLHDVLRRKGNVEIYGVHGIPMHPHMRDENGALNCFMTVFLDGIMISQGGRAASGGNPIGLRDLIGVHALEAVEVYRSAAQVPIEFGGSRAQCGVIVLWTKRG
jgi:hypothetical protein